MTEDVEPISDFIADFQNGDRTYADKHEVEALIARLDATTEKLAEAEQRATEYAEAAQKANNCLAAAEAALEAIEDGCGSSASDWWLSVILDNYHAPRRPHRHTGGRRVRGIGVHVCEVCGKVYDTIGEYLNCRESHEPPTQEGNFAPEDVGKPVELFVDDWLEPHG